MASRRAKPAPGQRAAWKRRFPPTREGWWFLLATLLVGAAAVNAGLNLLFLVFGMMIFFILASGVLSELALKGLDVTRRPPGAIHAGTPFLMGISVRNDKKRAPTFSLEVEDLIAGRPVDRRCYFLKIPAGRQQETAYRHTLHRRGLHKLTGFRVSTRFPFGLIRKSRDIETEQDLLVFPALVSVPDAYLPAPLSNDWAASATRPSRAGEFHGLREFRIGEDPRQIHWRSSARRGRMLLRESEEETGRELYVVLEEPARKAEGDDKGYEAAVSMAASIALRLGKRGFQVGLVAGGRVLPPGSGAGHAHEVLRRLALVQAGAAERAAWPLKASAVVVRPGRERAELSFVLAGDPSRRSA